MLTCSLVSESLPTFASLKLHYIEIYEKMHTQWNMATSSGNKQWYAFEFYFWVSLENVENLLLSKWLLQPWIVRGEKEKSSVALCAYVLTHALVAHKN